MEGHELVDDASAKIEDDGGADATEARDATVRKCDSGLEWLSASGCGRYLRSRRDPFSLAEANHTFYQEFEELGDMLPPAFVLPLRLEAADSGTAPSEEIEEKGGLVCRVYVLSSREEFVQTGLHVQGCPVPEFAVVAHTKTVLPDPHDCGVDLQHSAADSQLADSREVSGVVEAVETGKGNSKGRNRAKSKGGSGTGGAAEDTGGGQAAVSAEESWPSLAPSRGHAADGVSRWSAVGEAANCTSVLIDAEEGERGGKGKVAGGASREREKEKARSKPLNPLQDALEAMFLASNKTREKGDSLEAGDGAVHREGALAAPKEVSRRDPGASVAILAHVGGPWVAATKSFDMRVTTACRARICFISGLSGCARF